MKKILFHFLVFIIAVSSFESITSLDAEAAGGEKTVLDYYLELPDEYFQCETANILQRKDKLSLIKKKDLNKGYIQASILDGGYPVEVAIFKGTDDYMGITVLAVNVRCTSGCMCRRLDFFFITDGKLAKVEGDFLFPKTEAIEKAAGRTEGYEFILPGDGKNIKVAEEGSGKEIFVIEWSEGSFNIK